MIYIDIEQLEAYLSPAWREQAARAEALVRQARETGLRGVLIDRHSRVWRELKHTLKGLSYGKCWYCESPGQRILGDVDHYRPKKRIDDPEHPHEGYWWLAFHWRNLRFACEICNRQTTDRTTGAVKGKGSLFPMADPASYRLSAEDYHDDDDLLREWPLLLDPTQPGDPQWISFEVDGRPVPASADPASLQYRRAVTSIRLYHLDHSALNLWRRDEIFKRVRRYVEIVAKTQTICEDLLAAPELLQVQRLRCKDALSELRCMLAPDAGYSAAARAYLKMYRRAEPAWAWVDLLLSASQLPRRATHGLPLSRNDVEEG